MFFDSGDVFPPVSSQTKMAKISVRDPFNGPKSDITYQYYIPKLVHFVHFVRTGRPSSPLKSTSSQFDEKYDKPTKSIKISIRLIVPFGRNDYTTNMFHPRKISQRLMKKYANWEETPGCIWESLFLLQTQKLNNKLYCKSFVTSKNFDSFKIRNHKLFEKNFIYNLSEIIEIFLK